MQENIKDKAVSGLFHSLVGTVGGNGINFIMGIILARLLTPTDYGLFGILTIFISISAIFVDGGMTTALIREKEVDDRDYSTVFYYNLGVSILAYSLLFFSANWISIFFKEPLLVNLIRVVSLNIIVGAFGNIQRVRLTRNFNFKAQAKIEILVAVLSSGIGVWLAYIGKGVWALVIMNLIRQIFTSAILMWVNKWRPLFVFDKATFKRLFNFGSKMLLTGILATIYQNIYNMIMGKSYSPDVLGYYTKAKSLKDMVATSILATVSKVAYPVLSSIQEDKEKFSLGFKKIINHISYLTFPMTIGMIAISKPMIIVLFGENWIDMVPYFRVLCFSSILFAQGALNLNVLQIVGRSDLFLKLDVIKMAIGLSLITLSVVLDLGMEGLLGTIVILSLIAFVANCFYSKKYLDYSLCKQVKDLLLPLGLSVAMGIAVYIITELLPYGDLINLIISIIVGIVFYILLSILFKVAEFWSIYGIVKEKCSMRMK